MKILFITSGSIGDAIISSGILNHLLEKHPEARFTIAGGIAAVTVFEAFPNLERIITVKKKKYNLHWPELWQKVRKDKWDIVVDLRGSLISYLVIAKKRYVFFNPDKTKSKADQIATMMKLENAPPTKLWSNAKAKEKAQAFLPEDKDIIVLAPKSAMLVKDWAIERFAALAQCLATKDTLFVVLATAAQKESVKPLVTALPSEQILDLSGKTELLTAYAILERSQLFIGNDSGLFHMAAAAGTKCVGIYGPSNDKVYAPKGAHIKVVKSYDFQIDEKAKKDNKYMEMISVDTVLQTVLAFKQS